MIISDGQSGVLLKGTIEGHEHSYSLDENHAFEKGRPVLVCGNTAAMLGEGGISHLAPHFQASDRRGWHAASRHRFEQAKFCRIGTS